MSKAGNKPLMRQSHLENVRILYKHIKDGELEINALNRALHLYNLEQPTVTALHAYVSVRYVKATIAWINSMFRSREIEAELVVLLKHLFFLN